MNQFVEHLQEARGLRDAVVIEQVPVLSHALWRGATLGVPLLTMRLTTAFEM